ncbi:MAG: hypothetical protein WC942_04140 [Clostridia bacterium]|jgi:hypothetical protein
MFFDFYTLKDRYLPAIRELDRQELNIETTVKNISLNAFNKQKDIIGFISQCETAIRTYILTDILNKKLAIYKIIGDKEGVKEIKSRLDKLV